MAVTHPVVEERHVVHSDDTSSAGMLAVVLVAALVIIGFVLFMMRAFPFNAMAPAGTNDGGNINIDLPNTAPGATAPGNTPANPSTDY
jgi:hypothetical protein